MVKIDIYIINGKEMKIGNQEYNRKWKNKLIFLRLIYIINLSYVNIKGFKKNPTLFFSDKSI